MRKLAHFGCGHLGEFVEHIVNRFELLGGEHRRVDCAQRKEVVLWLAEEVLIDELRLTGYQQPVLDICELTRNGPTEGV